MLKPITPDACVDVVHPGDPSIDKDKTDMEVYRKAWARNPGIWKSGGTVTIDSSTVEFSGLAFLDGQTPTVFTIGVLPPGEMCRMEDESASDSAASLRWESFLWGVRRVSNFASEAPSVDRSGVSYVDPKWLAKQFIGHLRVVATHIGAAIWIWNQLDEESVKN